MTPSSGGGRAHQRVTLQTVAREAGVSLTTASFVLSGRKDGKRPASDRTRDRVTEVASRLGYIPNAHAQAMRTGRTNSLALALGDPRDPWASHMAAMVAEHASTFGLSTVALVDESWHALLQGQRFDAAFVTGADATHEARRQVRELAQQGHPMVLHTALFEPEQFDVIHSHAGTAIPQAFERLRARHDRVHFMARPTMPVEPPLRTRAEAFLEAATRHGDDGSSLERWVRPTLQAARIDAVEWLTSRDRPTAVITQNGQLAMALQAAAIEVGMAMPDDLEIIAMGDVPDAVTVFGPISHYGADEVFATVAEAVVRRALNPLDPWLRIDLAWGFHAGATTRD